MIITVIAFSVLSGCSDSKPTKNGASPAKVVQGQTQEQSDTGRIVEAKLDAIVRGSQANHLSSNPYDYIMGSKDYDDIVMMGDRAFRYMLKKLQTSPQDGLKEYIMSIACAGWMGEDPRNGKWSSGKEWFKDFVSKRSALSSGGSSQEVADFDHIRSGFLYPYTWPKMEILNGNQRIYWDRGDANFTGQPGGVIGNTNFGMNEEHVDILRTNMVQPDSPIVFKPAAVQGLDTPKFKLEQLNQDHSSSVYLLQQNTMRTPKETGAYIFILTVDWGKGDNNISYWFKLKVS